jgi:hypothetical protein
MNPGMPFSEFSGSKNGRTFKLEVAQQPVRARMCGFGDKDRRPITPPPCIRLIVCDPTGQEIDPDSVDSTFFVLTVDLWNADGAHEVNLVRHSSGAPSVSISSSTTTSYPPPPDRQLAMYSAIMPPFDAYGRPMHPAQYPGSAHLPPNFYAPNVQGGPPPPHPYASHPSYPPPAPMAMPVQPPTTASAGMFTRNLIGSLAVNAFKLNDTEGKPGFWFVLQDLSVRTEGIFRYVAHTPVAFRT